MKIAILLLVLVLGISAQVQDYYYGCFLDSLPTDPLLSHLLSGKLLNIPGLTVGLCREYCASESFFLYGLLAGSNCYCSNAVTTSGGSILSGVPLVNYLTSRLGNTLLCAYPCPGNPAQLCGGLQNLALYLNTELAVLRGVNLNLLAIDLRLLGLQIGVGLGVDLAGLALAQTDAATNVPPPAPGAPAWAIAIFVVGALLVIAIIVGLLVWYKRRSGEPETL
eukprot:TRINITY_DN5123_c0_g1_i1.p1 TRINITY_DN5123_c0_g1~~TRINITY_DN5123_c0_g1_i1.p1  ORF type:complete len:222 (+),score=27.20 TRINITY_DN5123_c0_g1_i1:27-692(+)